METTRSLLFSGNILIDEKQNNDYVPIVFPEPVIIEEIKLISNGKPCHQKLRHISKTSKNKIGPLKFYINFSKVKDNSSCFKQYISYDDCSIIRHDLQLKPIETSPCDILLLEGTFDVLTLNIYGVFYSSLFDEEKDQLPYYQSTDDLLNNDGNINEIELGYNNAGVLKSQFQPQIPPIPTGIETAYSNLVTANELLFDYDNKNNPDIVYDLFAPITEFEPTLLNDDIISGSKLLSNENLLDSWIKNINSFNIYQIYFSSLSNKNIKAESLKWKNEEFYLICSDITSNDEKYKQLCDQYRYNWKSVTEWVSDTENISSNHSKLKAFVIIFKNLLVYKYLRQKQPFDEFITSILDRVLLWMTDDFNINVPANYLVTLLEYSVIIIGDIWLLVQNEVSDVLTTFKDETIELLMKMFHNPHIHDSLKCDIIKIFISMCFNENHIEQFLRAHINIDNVGMASVYRVLVDEYFKDDNEYSNYTWRPVLKELLQLIKYHQNFKTLKTLITNYMNDQHVIQKNNNQTELTSILGSIVECFETMMIDFCQNILDPIIQNPNSNTPNIGILSEKRRTIISDHHGNQFQELIFKYALRNNFVECLICIITSPAFNSPNVNFLIKCLLFQMISLDYGKYYLFHNPTSLNHLTSLLFTLKTELSESEDKPFFGEILKDITILDKINWSQFVLLFLLELQVFQLCDKLDKCFEDEKDFLIDDVESPELIATLHTLVRIMLQSKLGCDCVLRAISIPNIFRHFCVLLHTTLDKSNKSGSSLKPITASYAMYILSTFLSEYDNTCDCLIKNLRVIIALIKIDDKNILKPITEWFLPLLHISNVDDYTSEMCNLIKEILENYVLNVERAKRLYLSLSLLLNSLSHQMDKVSSSISMESSRIQLALKMIDINVVDIFALFAKQFKVVTTNMGFFRCDTLGRLLIKSFNIVVPLLQLLLPSISDFSDNGDENIIDQKLSNFDRKLVKSLMILNVYSLLMKHNHQLCSYVCPTNINIEQLTLNCQLLLNSYLNEHTVAPNYLTNNTNHIHLFSCHHYSVRLLLKFLKSSFQIIPYSLVMLHNIILSSGNSLNNDDYIWQNIGVCYWDDFSWMINLCLSTKNIFLNTYCLNIVALLTYKGNQLSNLIIDFLLNKILSTWDYAVNDNKQSLINYLRCMSFLSKYPFNAVALLKRLSNIYQLTPDNFEFFKKEQLIHLISTLADSTADHKEYNNLMIQRDIHFIKLLDDCFTNRSIINNNIAIIDFNDLDLIKIFISKLYKSVNCFASYETDKTNDSPWLRINSEIIKLFHNLCFAGKESLFRIVVIQTINKQCSHLAGLINTSKFENNNKIKNLVAKLLHSILPLDERYPLINHILQTSFTSLQHEQIHSLLNFFDELVTTNNSVFSNLDCSPLSNISESIDTSSSDTYEILRENSLPHYDELISSLSSANITTNSIVTSSSSSEELFNMDPFNLTEFIKLCENLKLQTKNKITLLCSSLISIPNKSRLKMASPVIQETNFTVSLINNSLLAMNKAITSAKAQVQIDTWRKNKCSTSRLPSLHVDDFTLIVNQGVVKETALKKSS